MNGIGGRTIQEAKHRLTHKEANTWLKYIRSKGSLNLGSRIEMSVGILSSMYEQVNNQGDVDLSRHFPNLLGEPTEQDHIKNEFEKWGIKYEQ